MNIKGFYVATLSSALDLDVATPDDVLVHTTPDVLADHLPRPLWARLLTACVGAPRVDAQLVVETIGVPNLCEHVPAPIMWNCISTIASRSLGQPVAAPAPYVRSDVAPQASAPDASLRTSAEVTIIREPLATPPPPEAMAPAPVPDRLGAVGPSIPALGTPPPASLADIVAELDSDDRIPSSSSRTRTPTQQRFRQSGTGIGRLANARRPQASTTPPADVASTPSRSKRDEGDYEIETETAAARAREDWQSNLGVEDEQLVDWQGSDETVTGRDDLGRKR